MASTSRIGVIRNTLKTLLSARGDLSGIPISLFEPAPTTKTTEAIWMGDAAADQDPAAPGSRFDDITLPLVVYVWKDGSGEDVAEAAEDRALALFAEVEALLGSDRTLGGIVLDSDITRYETTNTVDDKRRTCELVAEVTFETQIDTS